MNKRVILLGIGVAVLLAGSFFFLMPKTAPLNNNGKVNTNLNKDVSETTNLFMSAFQGSDSIKCTYTVDGLAGTAYIKQGKIRVDSAGTNGSKYGNAIIIGNIIYAWQTGIGTGIMIDISKIQNSQLQPQGFITAEAVKTAIEQNQPSCVKETIDDAVFSPPASVKFTDYSTLFQQSQGGTMTKDQYQQLLEQYGQ